MERNKRFIMSQNQIMRSKRVITAFLALLLILFSVSHGSLIQVGAETDTSAAVIYTISEPTDNNYTVVGGSLTSRSYTDIGTAVNAIVFDSDGKADIAFDNISAYKSNLEIVSACELTFRGSLSVEDDISIIDISANDVIIHNYANLTMLTEGRYTISISDTSRNVSISHNSGAISGGSIALNGSSNLIVNGGNINANTTVYPNASLIVNAGTINGKSSSEYAIYNSGLVELNGGQININNTAGATEVIAIESAGSSHLKLTGTVDVNATSNNSSAKTGAIRYYTAAAFSTIDAAGVTSFARAWKFLCTTAAMSGISGRAVWMQGRAENINIIEANTDLLVTDDDAGVYNNYDSVIYQADKLLIRDPDAALSQINTGDITEAVLTQSGANVNVQYKLSGNTNSATYCDTAISDVISDVIFADTTNGCDFVMGSRDKSISVSGDVTIDTGADDSLSLYGKVDGVCTVIGTGTVISYIDAAGFDCATASTINLLDGNISAASGPAVYLELADLNIDGASVSASGDYNAVKTSGTGDVTITSGSVSAANIAISMNRSLSGGDSGKLSIAGGTIWSSGSSAISVNVAGDFTKTGGSVNGSDGAWDIIISNGTTGSCNKEFVVSGEFDLDRILIENGDQDVVFDVSNAAIPENVTDINVKYKALPSNVSLSKTLWKLSVNNYQDFYTKTNVVYTFGSTGTIETELTNALLYDIEDDIYLNAANFNAVSVAYDLSGDGQTDYLETLVKDSLLGYVLPSVITDFKSWAKADGNYFTPQSIISENISLYPTYNATLSASDVYEINSNSAKVRLSSNSCDIFWMSTEPSTANELISIAEQYNQKLTPENGEAVFAITGLEPNASYNRYFVARHSSGEVSAIVTVSFTTSRQTADVSDFVVSNATDLRYDGTEKAVTVSGTGGVEAMGEITISYAKINDAAGNSITETQIDGIPIDAGTYNIYIQTTGGNQFSPVSEPLCIDEYTIQRASVNEAIDSITSYVGTYDTQSHNAINVQLKSNYVDLEISYRTDNQSEYQTTVPTVRAAGDTDIYVKISGDDNYYDDYEMLYTSVITPYSLNSVGDNLFAINDSYYYTGQNVNIEPEVRALGQLLQRGIDYTVMFENNIDPHDGSSIGAPAITVIGQGNYSGGLKKTFAIEFFDGSVSLLYKGSTEEAVWYADDVAISAPGYTISDRLSGTFADVYMITGSGSNVEKMLYFKQDETGYITDSQLVSVNIDKSAPTGSISMHYKLWDRFLSLITFGRYEAIDKSITITAEDDDSGILTEGGIQYAIVIGDSQYESAEALEAAAAAGEIRWIEYDPDNKPQIAENTNTVVYVKLSDNMDNESYIRSDGLFIDTQAPVVSELEMQSVQQNDISAAVRFKTDEAATVYMMVLPADTTIDYSAYDIIASCNGEDTDAGSVIDEALSIYIIDVCENEIDDVHTQVISGLKPNQNYSVVLTAQDHMILMDSTIDYDSPVYISHTSSPQLISFMTTRSAISGNVIIAGEAVVGETLAVSADLEVEDAGEIYYSWYRGDQLIDGAGESTYTLTSEDFGYTIEVKINAENCFGDLSRSITATDNGSEQVIKANSPIANLPLIIEMNDTYGMDFLKFAGMNNIAYEYSIDGGETWLDTSSSIGEFSERAYWVIEIGDVAIPEQMIHIRSKETGGCYASESIRNVQAFTIYIAPEETEENSVDEGDGVPDNSETPELTFWQNVINNVNNEIDESKETGAESPAQIHVNISRSSIIPAEVFMAIRGENIDLVLHVSDGLFWTLNGNDVDDIGLSDVNMTVNRVVDRISDSALQRLPSVNQNVQIELTHNGSFGFRATLSINLAEASSGKYANLFYYNENTGKLEFVRSSIIDSDRNSAFVFDHASVYTVVMSDVPMSAASLNSDSQSPTDEDVSGEVTPDNSPFVNEDEPKQSTENSDKTVPQIETGSSQDSQASEDNSDTEVDSADSDSPEEIHTEVDNTEKDPNIDNHTDDEGADDVKSELIDNHTDDEGADETNDNNNLIIWLIIAASMAIFLTGVVIVVKMKRAEQE